MTPGTLAVDRAAGTATFDGDLTVRVAWNALVAMWSVSYGGACVGFFGARGVCGTPGMARADLFRLRAAWDAAEDGGRWSGT